MRNINFKAVGGFQLSKVERIQQTKLIRTFDRSIALFDPHSYQFREIGINTVDNFASICSKEFEKKEKNHNLFEIAAQCTKEAYKLGKTSMLLATKNLPIRIPKKEFDISMSYSSRFFGNFNQNLEDFYKQYEYNESYDEDTKPDTIELNTISLYLGGNVDAAVFTKEGYDEIVKSKDHEIPKKNHYYDIRMGYSGEMPSRDLRHFFPYKENDILLLKSKGITNYVTDEVLGS